MVAVILTMPGFHDGRLSHPRHLFRISSISVSIRSGGRSCEPIPYVVSSATGPSKKRHGIKNARDAIRTHEPLQEWILSPSELAGLSYPRTLIDNITLQSDILSPVELTGQSDPNALNY